MGIHKGLVAFISLALAITTVTSVHAYPYPDSSAEYPEDFTYDIQVPVGNQTIGFVDLSVSDEYYIGYSDTGLLYVNNTGDATLGIMVVNNDANTSNSFTIKKHTDSFISMTDGANYYEVKVFHQLRDKSYELLNKFHCFVDCDDEALKLLPSYYCNFEEYIDEVSLLNSKVLKSDVQLANLVEVFTYLSGINYDTELANQVNVNKTEIYRSDLGKVIDTEKGICLDSASLGVAMLRMKNIPSSLCFGYVGDKYHAWIEAEVGGSVYLIDSVNNCFDLVDNISSYVTVKSF